MNAPFAIGIGARRGVDAEELVALVERMMAQHAPSPRLRGEGWGERLGIGPATSATTAERSAVGAKPPAPHPLPVNGEREWPALFTIDTKQDEAGLHEAARLLRTTIVFLPLEALARRKDDILTRSVRVERLTGVGSVAEAAALAGAGPGSRLLAPRMATDRLTCAIAQSALEEAP